MNDPIVARDWYWHAHRCPGCGQLVRATSVLRGWADHPRPALAPEALITRSHGPGKIENSRWPLTEFLTALPREARREAVYRFDDFYTRLERRLFDGAYETRTAASAVRYL